MELPVNAGGPSSCTLLITYASNDRMEGFNLPPEGHSPIRPHSRFRRQACPSGSRSGSGGRTERMPGPADRRARWRDRSGKSVLTG